MPRRILSILCLPWLVLGLGCTGTPRNYEAVRAYYDYDFRRAREALRGDAELKNDEQVVLDNLRLGVASLADGDSIESERALGRTFDFLSTAGLNRDRTTAAVWVNEGVRIWKGEPFEQALAYYYVSALYATLGDWENVRAAATNSLFRLTDFGEDKFGGDLDQEELARRAAEDDSYLEEGYTAVDTNFALGFLLQAIGADLSGLGGADPQFDAAMEINPDLESIVRTLRSGEYDTLLLVDYGKGPTKIAYGPDNALARFDPQDRAGNTLTATVDGRRLGEFPGVADVNAMSLDHRWKNLEDVRKAKSAIGRFLIAGGATAAYIGAHSDSEEAVLAGLGAMLAGAITKSGAAADTRYFEFAPAEVFLVPLKLGRTGGLRVSVARSEIVLPDFRPGAPGAPRAAYIRLHGPDSPRPAWLTATDLVYSNDHTGVRPGDYAWILGGGDLSTPNRQTLEAYQAGGHLQNLTVAGLRELYRAEDILIGSGMENRPDVRKNPSFRHVLENGTGLFTPQPDSMGYKQLMYSRFPPYEPRSDLVREFKSRLETSSRQTVEETLE